MTPTEWKSESATKQPTDGPTNQLTGVGARDACAYASKKSRKDFLQEC